MQVSFGEYVIICIHTQTRTHIHAHTDTHTHTHRHPHAHIHTTRTYNCCILAILLKPCPTVYGKTFKWENFRGCAHKIHYSLENFHGASGRGHHVLYTASDSRGKLSRSAEKPRKFSHSKVLPYTVL